MYWFLTKEVIFESLAKLGFEVVGLTLFEEIMICIVANIAFYVFWFFWLAIIWKILVRIKRFIF